MSLTFVNAADGFKENETVSLLWNRETAYYNIDSFLNDLAGKTWEKYFASGAGKKRLVQSATRQLANGDYCFTLDTGYAAGTYISLGSLFDAAIQFCDRETLTLLKQIIDHHNGNLITMMPESNSRDYKQRSAFVDVTDAPQFHIDMTVYEYVCAVTYTLGHAALINDMKALFKTKTLTKAKKQRFAFKWTRWMTNERNTDRVWREAIYDNWNDESFAKYYQSAIGNAEPVQVPDLFEFIDMSNIKKLLRFIPSAFVHIDAMIQTKGESETPRSSQMAQLTHATISTQHSDTFAHAFIQHSKQKYEYVVGESNVVMAKIHDNDTIFHESICEIRPDYLTDIHEKIRQIMMQEPKRAITFDGHTLIVRNKANTTIAEFARIYRKSQMK